MKRLLSTLLILFFTTTLVFAGPPVAPQSGANLSGESGYSGEHDFGGADLIINSGTSLPANCTVGELFLDTDADTNGSIFMCRATDSWKEMDDDGGAGGGGDLLADGSIPLTANWDVGAYSLRATLFISDIAIGTAPLTVTSTTVVTNLNADLLDGESAAAFEDADAAIVKSDEAETLSANWVNTANPWANNEVADALTVTAQAGSTWNIDDSITALSVYTGTTSLDESTAADDSGAYIIGVYDEFTNSDATNIQDVLDDLDAAIAGGGTTLGDIVTTSPLTVDGGANLDNVLPGADADVTFAIADAAADGATKGAATFNADDFDAAAGVISIDTTNFTIVDLGLTASLSEINTPLDGASVTLTEFQELETIGTTTISAAQWGYLGGFDQDLQTTDNVTFNTGTFTNGITLGATADPLWEFNDSNAAGADADDEEAARIYANMITTTEDAEDSDFWITIMQGGSRTTVILFDESDDQWESTKAFNIGALTATGITVGAAALTEAELEVIDGLTGVTTTELSYIGDVTSALQAQMDNKPELDGEVGYTGEHNFDGADVVIQSGTSLPGTCTTGELFYDTDADTNGSLYGCRTTDTWKEVDDDGAAGSGTMTTVKEADAGVGGADIVTIDFGAGFDLVESPDTEIQISLDLTEVTIPDFALAANADAGDFDIQSIDKLEGVDAAVYIDMGADGIVEIESDTLITAEAPNIRLRFDSLAYLNIATADGGITVISQTSDGTDQITLGDGADRIDISSDTWDVTNGVFSGGSIATTGTISGGSLTPVTDSTADFAANFTGANLYGGTFIANADDGDLVIPAVGVGMNFTVITLGAIEVVADPNAADLMITDGVAGADGENITNLSTAGDIAVFQYYDATGWLVTTNGWTPE